MIRKSRFAASFKSIPNWIRPLKLPKKLSQIAYNIRGLACKVKYQISSPLYDLLHQIKGFFGTRTFIISGQRSVLEKKRRKISKFRCESLDATQNWSYVPQMEFGRCPIWAGLYLKQGSRQCRASANSAVKAQCLATLSATPITDHVGVFCRI